jgi:hypothetical protein
MAEVVLVHGIAQQNRGEQVLMSTEWLPAMSDGVRKSGNTTLADRIFSGTPGDLDVQMAYYGDLFPTDTPLPEPATAKELQTAPLPAGADEKLIGEFGKAMLDAAATEAAVSTTDRHTAGGAMAVVNGEAGPDQGPKELLRPVLNGLASLRWFSDPVMRVAAPVVWRTVTQVSQYMSDKGIRSRSQQRVLDLIDDDTRLVIGHSLGSVVAYETLHHTTQPLALITLGSPLGLKNIIWSKDRLQVWPAHVPATVTSWYNFAAKDDLVAARLDIADYFPPAPGRDVTPISHIVDTGSNAHNIVHYLTQPSCGQAVTYALT